MNTSKRNDSRRLLVLGLFLLVVANLLRWGLHPSTSISANTLDAILGFCYGASIAILLIGVRRHARQRNSGTCA